MWIYEKIQMVPGWFLSTPPNAILVASKNCTGGRCPNQRTPGSSSNIYLVSDRRLFAWQRYSGLIGVPLRKISTQITETIGDRYGD